MQNALKSNEWQRMWVLNTFKIEIQRRDQIILTICRICSTKKSGPPSLTCKNYRCVTAALLNHTECIEMYWMMKNLGPSKFLNWVTEGGTKQFRLSLKLVVLQEIRSPIFNLKKKMKSMRKVLLIQRECIDI